MFILIASRMYLGLTMSMYTYSCANKVLDIYTHTYIYIHIHILNFKQEKERKVLLLLLKKYFPIFKKLKKLKNIIFYYYLKNSFYIWRCNCGGPVEIRASSSPIRYIIFINIHIYVCLHI
jgi:hypothetical protein